MSKEIKKAIDIYLERINKIIDQSLPESNGNHSSLHEAMRYSTLNGGKRIRPLLIYSCGECLGIEKEKLDVPALSIELLHSFSLVHDDLPSMDNDNLRRGLPTTHKKFSESTAILAADALQTLAFGSIADAKSITDEQKVRLISLISDACGAKGMTGGQSMDLASEGKILKKSELHSMHKMKTGALIHASIMAPFCFTQDYDEKKIQQMDRFGWAIGIAFQIRDDLIDIEESSDVTGKDQNSDIKNDKATWPSHFGKEASYEYCSELLNECLKSLDIFNNEAELLRWLTQYLIDRKN
ncbi:MAG: geranyl transferase [Woeseiaceae bacterium]|nr:geranyl transferase [Woeseiaceae bacterium]